MRFSFLAVIALLIAAFGTGPAVAHTKSETQSVWRINGSNVHVTFSVPTLEARRLTQNRSVPGNDEIAAYLDQHIHVLNGEVPCERAGMIQPVAASPTFHRFELNFRCESPDDIVLASSAFFDLVPTHVTYAQIVPESGTFVSQLFTADQQSMPLASAAGTELTDASFFDYVLLGVDHIFTGYDHQAFILALVLLSARLRDLIFVITGFTLGHSLSLSLAVIGILRPQPQFIDCLVALTIAMVAAENMAHSAHRTRTIALAFGGMIGAFVLAHLLGVLGGPPVPLLIGAGIFAVCYMMMSGYIKDAARLRLIVTLTFGTIHGFSFANSLREMQLPTGRLAELLFGFNVGVELGQLCVVAVILGFVAILSKLRLTLPRPLVVDVLSSALVGLGLFWFVTKAYGGG